MANKKQQIVAVEVLVERLKLNVGALEIDAPDGTANSAKIRMLQRGEWHELDGVSEVHVILRGGEPVECYVFYDVMGLAAKHDR